MGILDLFKKKSKNTFEDDTNNLGLDDDPFKSDPLMDPNSGLNLPQENHNMQQNDILNQNPFKKYQEQNSYEYQQHNQQHNQQPTLENKDLQIIIAKIDALRAEVQTLNHKIENLERKQQKKMW